MKRFLFVVLLTGLFCNANAQKVGIGNTNPSETLDVTGNVKADSVKTNVVKIINNIGKGKILTSDSLGNGTWQKANAGKGYNGITTSNDTINFGGRLYVGTDLNLASNQLFFRDIGSQNVDVATSTIATLSTIGLSATPLTQTFRPSISCKLDTLLLNITALSGGIINIQLLDDNGLAIDGSGVGFGTLTNGLYVFPFNVYLSNTKTYKLSITGNATAFVNYDASNPYANGISSISATADLGFIARGYGEENLLTMTGNKIGIGTSTPTEMLDVNGNAKANKIIATSGLQLLNNAGTNKILLSDAAGNATWSSANTIAGTVSSANEMSGPLITPSPSIANIWQFATIATNTITLNGNQRVIMSLTVPLGVNAVNNTFAGVDLDVGFQNTLTTTITNASGINYSNFSINFPTIIRNPYSVHGSFKPAAGTYRIGPIIRCNVANYFTGNDFFTGYYMIVNE